MAKMLQTVVMALAIAVMVCAAAAHETMKGDAEVTASIARKGWQPLARAPADHALRLTLALKQTNVAALTAKLYDVSDPSSENYGAFLSHDEVNLLVAPSSETVSSVMQWLSQAGHEVITGTPNKDFLHVDMTVAQAEQLLSATYWTYMHKETGSTLVRLAPSTSYMLPEAVAPIVDFVAPTVTFPPPQFAPNPRRPSASASTSALRGIQAKPAITPPRLRALANMSETDVGHGAGNGIKQGVASFLGQFYAPSDLKDFRTKYKMTTKNLSALLVPVPAGQKHSPVGVEASMDVQYITSTGDQVTTEHWSTPGKQPGNPENEPFIAFLANVANATNPPSLFSISYGDEEDGVSEEYALRCSVEFQKAGVRGITLLAASGDSGVGCGTAGFIPTFPASCPYVTGVGAVQGGTPGKSPTGEFVADLSGGGFSNYFTRPNYQDDAVKNYLSKGTSIPAQRNWNASGAGFPDIAAQGILFDVCTEDFFYPYSGTSAACPSATGVLSVLTQDRVDAKMTKFGWINPLLYKMGADEDTSKVFNDVTEGTNNFCGDDTGFSAASGWDPVSGWGTLNYGKLKATLAAATPAEGEHEDTVAPVSTGCVHLVDYTNPSSPKGQQHCQQLDNPGGCDSDYFKSKGWKYTNPPWNNGTCDTKKFNYMNKQIKNLDGFDGVTFTIWGIAGSKKMESKHFGRGYKFDPSKKDEHMILSRMPQPYQRVQQAEIPASVDWRTKGAVSPVRDQGQGETCWAFSTAGAVEGAAVAVGGAANITPLSPQSLIDCMGIDCSDSSGTPDNAFAWIAKHNNGSMYTWDSYPYVDGNCIFWDPPHTCLKNGTLDNELGARVTGYHHTIVNNETDLMLAVAQQPVSVAIYSGLGSFTTYKGGVYYDKGCEDVTTKMLDHAVLLVGYGTTTGDNGETAGEDYWIVKNSWTNKWGENGYIRMRRNVRSESGLCGISIDASFPQIA